MKSFPKARQYKDFRKMLEEMDRQIDAVTVSIPDHQHAVAAMMAMRMGKPTTISAATIARAGRSDHPAQPDGHRNPTPDVRSSPKSPFDSTEISFYRTTRFTPEPAGVPEDQDVAQGCGGRTGPHCCHD